MSTQRSAALKIAIISLAVPIVPFVILGELPGLDLLGQTNVAWFALAGIALLAADILLPVPSSLVAVALAARLGPTAGMAAIFCGLMLSSLIGWTVGRTIGTRRRLERALVARTQRWPLVTAAATRAVPILAEATVIALGAIPISRRAALGTLAAANLGLAAVYSATGAAAAGSSAWIVAGAVAVPLIAAALAVPVLGALDRQDRP